MKHTRIIILLLFICLISTWAWGETHYVQNGAWENDWSASTDINHPTGYTQANSNVVPGDTIIFLNGGGAFTGSFLIYPTNNGTEENPITYKGQDNTEVVLASISRSAQLSGKSYINIENFTFVGAGDMWISMRGAMIDPPKATHHITISNCTFKPQTSTHWAGIYMYGDVSYVRILNNTITGGVGADPGHGDLVYAVAGAGHSIHHNLIEGNTFYGGYHVALEFQAYEGTAEYNIIRNNTISNPNHTALNVYGGSGATLVENNYIYDAGSICNAENCEENVHGSSKDRSNPRWVHGGIQFGASYSIIRNNTIINNGLGLSIASFGEALSQHDRVYHNTFDKNYRGIDMNCTGPLYDNIMKNNIIYDCVDYTIYRSLTGSPNDNYFFNNDFFGNVNIRSGYSNFPCGNTDLECLQTNHNDEWQDNIIIEPQFVNTEKRDLHLKTSSPLINVGAFLTKTTGAGSGQNIQVADARYFMDGWGLIEGDLIQLEGQSNRVRITNVNYSTNTITIDQNISWNANQGVTLAYNGSCPDIGAYEFFSPPVNFRFN